MGGYIHQQLLLATGRTHHELVQSTDCILRQLTLRAEHAYTQSSQVQGRIHRELLQMAGNVHYQLLMASSLPSYYGQQDVSPSANADKGRRVHYQLLTASFPSNHYGQEDVSPPANADGGRYGAKEEGQEE